MGALQSGIMYSFSLYQIMQSIVLKFGCKKKRKKRMIIIQNFQYIILECVYITVTLRQSFFSEILEDVLAVIAGGAQVW